MAGKKLTKAEIERLTQPSAFAESFLGMRLYPKQAMTMDLVAPAGSCVSLVAANETGKTSRIIAGLILWHLTVFPKGHIISTSGSFRQIKSQLVPHLHRYKEVFPGLTFFRSPRIEAPDPSCYWEGFSTNEGGKFEGHHEDGPDRPLLIIVDEAKTVGDEIFESIDRCKPTRLLIASSPGAPEGEFYRSHTSRKEFYSTVKMDALECPHIEQSWIDRMEAKWTKDHPLVRSMIYAEFMINIEGAIVNAGHLDRLLADPPNFDKKNGERSAFCDFAAGGDENVIALRTGNKVTLEDCWRDTDTMSAVGRFISNFVKLGLKPSEIFCDSGGLGHVMCDALMHAGWPVNRVNFGSKSSFKHYANVSAEIWFEGALAIEKGKVILPDDQDLRGQLISRKRGYDNDKGTLRTETKDDMRRRGLPSPDRADAVLGCMRKINAPSPESMEARDDFWERLQAQEYSELAGMHAGEY